MRKNYRKSFSRNVAAGLVGLITLFVCMSQCVDAAQFKEDSGIQSTILQEDSSSDISTNDISTNDVFTKEEIQSFIDDYFEDNMDTYDTPGVAVAIVKGTEELLTSSYGYADLDGETPVDASTTTFPACSVSKLFTATAIMQLYEQGEIDLNEDIRTYLGDLEIRNSFDEPITCAELLTHTSGLDEESELNGSTLDQSQILSQAVYFENHIPTVIHEPGSICCYSNMGFNLLGYIVENVSGESYESYIREHILEPLQMEASSVRIEDDQMATGYENLGSGNEEQDFAYQYTSGSSGVIGTVCDMENFMIMHLNNGTYLNQTILQDTTEQMMQAQQFANASVYDGMGYGWIRDSYNGNQIIKHEGALPGYTTTLLLLPDEQIGIYVATNSTTGICFDFEEAFLEHFYGTRITNPLDLSIVDAEQSEINQYIGTYRSYDGIGITNIMKLGILFDDTDLTVSKEENGKLKAVLYNQEKEREETLLDYCGDGVFLREDGKGYLTFRLDETGKATYAFTEVSHCTYEKCQILESKSILLTGLATIPVMLLLSIILLVQIIRKKWHGACFQCYATGLVFGQTVAAVSVIAAVTLELIMIMKYQYQSIWVLNVLLTLLMLGIIIMVVTTVYGIYLVIRKKVKKKAAVMIGIVGCFQLIFIAEMIYFQMIGIHIY